LSIINRIETFAAVKKIQDRVNMLT